MKWRERNKTIWRREGYQETEEVLNVIYTEVTEMLISASNKRKRNPTFPGSEHLNKAKLTHQVWKIASKVLQTRSGFVDRVNHLAVKLKIKENQQKWTHPRMVPSKLRKKEQGQKRLEKEAINPKAREREQRMTWKIHSNQNNESSPKVITHRMRQRYQF